MPHFLSPKAGYQLEKHSLYAYWIYMHDWTQGPLNQMLEHAYVRLLLDPFLQTFPIDLHVLNTPKALSRNR